MPKELMLMRRSRPAGQAVGWTGTLRWFVSNGTGSASADVLSFVQQQPLSDLHSCAAEEKLPLLYLLRGFGFLNLMLGGIVWCSKARTALKRLEMPEAPSEWPTFGLSYVRQNILGAGQCRAYRTNMDATCAKYTGYGFELNRIAGGSPCSVALSNSQIQIKRKLD